MISENSYTNKNERKRNYSVTRDSLNIKNESFPNFTPQIDLFIHQFGWLV